MSRFWSRTTSPLGSVATFLGMRASAPLTLPRSENSDLARFHRLDLPSPHALVNVAFPASLCKSARERGFAQEWPRGSRSAPLPDWFVTEGPKGIHGKGSLLCLEILKANHVPFSFRLPSQEVVEHRLLMLLMLKVATFTKSLSRP